MRLLTGEARRRPPAGESSRRRPRGGLSERLLRRGGDSLRDSLRRTGDAGLHACTLAVKWTTRDTDSTDSCFSKPIITGECNPTQSLSPATCPRRFQLLR